MEPITAIAAFASLAAITSAVVGVVDSAKSVSARQRKQDARILLKFDVNGKEVHVEYDSGKCGKHKPEEVNRIVESLKTASK